MFSGSYYNPYMFQPYQTASRLASSGLGIKGLFQRFNFNNFLTSTGKTLNVINQAIPIFYQVKPIINNARTMLRVVGAVRGNDNENKTVTNPSQRFSNNNSINSHNNYSNNTNAYQATTNNSDNSIINKNPTFFL